VKAEVINRIEVIITLSEKEARWLKEVVQNPIGCIDSAEEDISEKSMRAAFWSALDILI